MQNGTTKTTNVLEINDGIINYNPPISYFYTNGTVKLKLKYDGGSSNYITFSIPKNLTSTDDIILKIDSGNYLVRKSTNYKYNDLPIASTTSLGGIIVGDNLTIDSNGKLNAQSGGSAATIQVGTTTTGEPGTDAQVTNSGTSSAAVFNFVIPKGADGAGGGVTNYNDLTNKPVINLSSEDTSNPIVLYNLDEGIYKIYGYIKYYPTYSGTTAITSPTLATVSKSSTTTYVQLLQPYGNKVVGYEITETSYKSQSDCPYDVGDIFLTTNSTNPSNKYAGTTWALWGSGKVPVGVDTNDSDFNTVEKTGGEKTHILTTSELPNHAKDGATTDGGWFAGEIKDYPSGNYKLTTAGNNSPHNNLQPYITCYMWKRIS